MKNKSKSLTALFASIALITCISNESLAKTAQKQASSDLESTSKTSSTSKIAVVDIDKIVQESTAIASIQKRVEKQKSEYESEIEKKQKELTAEQKKIEDKRDILSKDAFEKEAKNFEKKADGLKTYTDKKQNSLKKAWTDGMGKVNDKVRSITAEIAKEKGIQVVIQSSQTLYHEDDLDITAEVLKALNNKMPKVELKFE